MLVLLGKNSEYIKELKQKLEHARYEYVHYTRYTKNAINHLYSETVKLAIIESDFAPLPNPIWIDILSLIGKRIPLVAFKINLTGTQGTLNAEWDFADFFFRENPRAQDTYDLIHAYHLTNMHKTTHIQNKIPLYDPEIPLKMLREQGAISFLAISGSKLRSVALEYGSETYSKLQDCFQGILFKLWGAPGSFRREDILVRRSPQGNDYIMFLQNNRSKSAVPAPGVTEKLANRVAFRIQTSLWEELLKSKENRILPDCLKVIPDISVGYATALNNPCEDTLEILNGVLEKSFEVAKLQQKRILDRQKEVMQTLIQNEGILYPNYQAVFKLSDLTKSQVEKVKEEKSIAPIANILMGFESLIRVKKELVEPLLRHDGLVYMDSNILRPDVLFQIAHATQISLELDQACLKQAIKMSGKLPGKLLVNILPRNLYYILSILPVQDFTKQIIFEISESESIQNFELIMKLTTQLKALNMSIATDDFGRGYAGLERVLRVQPELIKLDRSLIENIHLERSKRAYVKGLVEAALDSCSSVLAEGVELWQEAQVLQDMGVELIQGFLLHKPQPVEVILEDLGLESDEFSYLQQPSVA